MKQTAAGQLEEVVWRGLGVSEGIAIGRVLRLHGSRQSIFRVTLDQSDIGAEVRRFHAAVQLALRQLESIKARAEKQLGEEQAYIFDAHLLMLQDRKLVGDIEHFIEQERANAEWAIKVVSDRLLSVYAEIKDDYLRERGSDIEDVVQRLLVALSGGRRSYKRLSENAIVIAEDLLPSAVAELDFDFVRAIATDAGGWTSHAAIIARGLGLPTVVGLKGLYRKARTGDQVVIDASKGCVILHPSPATISDYTSQQAPGNRCSSNSGDAASEAVRTLDGEEVWLRANVELPAEFDGIKRVGASGIGLYRTEFLFTQFGGGPGEEDQRKVYERVAQVAGADGATIRLFDLGGDKYSGFVSEPERNPALGLRAIRLSLRSESLLRVQVRAVLRAAAVGHLDLVLPMVNDVADVRSAKRIIAEERAKLQTENIAHGTVRIGAMIEVPSAVLTAAVIAREVDFFSLGTNDLVQYTLAVDRGNEQVADWFRTLHPAVLISIHRTIAAAAAQRIPAVVCGEMAGTPAYAVILIGLGARMLSMATGSVPRIRKVLSSIRCADAAEVALKCLEAETADDVEQLVRTDFLRRWPDLFSPETLPESGNSSRPYTI